MLQYYALERWLFRLSQSKHRELFVLKGALLFFVWKTPATRPTRDIDLLGRLSNDLESIRTVVAEVCQIQVDDDGLVFDPTSVTTERIAEDVDYEGVRATFNAKLDNARIAMQVDIGFRDVITPAPAKISYHTILEQPPAELLAYNRETAIAEKFEAMVKLGELNSRMKDFFDVSMLATNFEFEGAALATAVSATFHRRQTEIQAAPVCFSNRFASDSNKAAQWKAFTKRSLLAETPEEFPDVVRRVRGFLQPMAFQLVNNDEIRSSWPRGGLWQLE